MAVSTRQSEYVAVIEPGAFPGFIRVAIVASVVAWNMFRVFSRCAAVVMTQNAFHGRASELSADMTAGAVQKLMLARQREAGREMIKAFIVVSSMC